MNGRKHDALAGRRPPAYAIEAARRYKTALIRRHHRERVLGGLFVAVVLIWRWRGVSR